MKQILVSIIVPVYNVEKYLGKCLRTLVNQTFKNMEILLINDGSPDNSQKIIEKYEKEYPGLVKGYIKENGGLSDARNYGLERSRGKYIGFVDGDDYVDLTMFEKLYNRASSTGADIAVCGYYAIDETIKETKKLQMGNMQHHNKSVFENPKLLYINAPYAWNKLYKKSLFEKSLIKFPKGIIFEDICTVYPLFLEANKIAKVDESLYYYFLKRDGSITGTYSPKASQILDSLGILNESFQKNESYHLFEKILLFINLKHIYNRFFDYRLYDNRSFQLDFVDRAYSHLDIYFPGWKKDNFYFDFNNKSKVVKGLFKKKLFWILIVYMPNSMVNFARYLYKVFVFTVIKNARFQYLYAWYFKYSKIRKNTVLFESFHGSSVSDSPYYLMRELIKAGEHKIFMTTNNRRAHKKYLKSKGLKAKLVNLKSIKYQKLLASCEYLVNNVSFPTYFIRKEGQHYLNTWHGTPIKTLGKKMKNGIESMYNIQRNLLQSDLLLFPNEFTRNCIMEDYNLEPLYTGKILMGGYPRNAIFLDKEKATETRKTLNIENKKVYAYLPTWRGANSYMVDGESYSDDLKRILKTIDECLKEDQVLFVNLHPILKNSIDMEGFKQIFSFPGNMDVYEFLNAADMLITDYSSVMFDFAITKKPILLFMYDYDAYMRERGFYFEPSSLPFKIVYDLKDLIGELGPNQIGQEYCYDSFLKEFNRYDSVSTTRDIIEKFFYGDSHAKSTDNHNENLEKAKTIVLMPKIDQIIEIENIYKKFGSDGIVYVFEKKHFDSELNKFLYEKYNNRMTYLVVSRIQICTYLEKIALRFLKSKRIASKVKERELRWCLPNLTIHMIKTECV